MKACLIAINAKYIHTNPAIYSLQAYSSSSGYDCDILEFTINQHAEQILMALYKEDADLYAFSAYIWNISMIIKLVRVLKKVRPNAVIWLGGPEAGYDAENLLYRFPEIEGIMKGEGEKVFTELLKAYNSDGISSLSDIQGIIYRLEDGSIKVNPDPPVMQMDELIFPYTGKKLDPNKIYYYESSRGCPFGCTYCLSSIERSVRFKNIETVKKELAFFLEQKVPLVKFVDRTFNINREHSTAIWEFIKENDNGITQFHFEIGGDLLDEDDLALLRTFRPGLIQFEIGVQTTNSETMKAINRAADWDVLSRNVKALLEFGNIHIHLDLIAGLPYEDIESFRKSFDDVFRLKPSQLQLGFLKMLKGTTLYTQSNSSFSGYKYLSEPPYEVLESPWLSYKDIVELKGVEEMLEEYHNSHRYEKSIAELLKSYDSSYKMFLELAEYYLSNGYLNIGLTRMRRYEILLEFIREKKLDESVFIPLLIMDADATERIKHLPRWAHGYNIVVPEHRG